jgi:OmcA/MtrC family decaheme c-type cytochrome
MIHKIHYGEELPSVLDPDGDPVTTTTGDYGIFGFSGNLASFNDVVFPQDIKNCTKCHDGTVGASNATAQGDNWKTQPNMAACGSCHDNVYFGASPDPLKPYQTVAHPGGVVTDNSECTVCHGPGRLADTALEHTNPARVAGAKFKFNLVSVTGGTTPSIQFSVTDPTNADAPYDIATGDATSNPVFKTPSTSRLAIDIGWSTADFTNNTSGANPAQPISIDPVNACDGTPIADWTCTPNSPSTGVYTLTKSTALPAGAVGTGRVGFEGHPAGVDSATGLYTVRVPVKNVVKDWSIDGSTLMARRTVVDIAKCNQCHDQLSLHGNNRTDEPQVCVMCHNPNDTDANRRPKTAAGILSGATVDGKPEESIDFKRMIHGIHGAAMREQGIVIYGFGGSANDFSGVRFPGILNDCTTCHTTSSYQLTGIWETPTENGILGSTISTTPTAVDAGTYATGLATPDDDLNITPTAAVCSSCHDGALQAQHMIMNGAVFAATQTDITNHSLLGGWETCAICHGPGSVADVKTVHGVK